MADEGTIKDSNGDCYDLNSLLTHPGRDFLIRNNGEQVPVSELEGKLVGLYFFHPSEHPCVEFTPKLVEVYEKLKEMGENFEIVTVLSFIGDEELFKQSFGSMPWLFLPTKDDSCRKLSPYFRIETLPTLVIIGPEGKTLHSNAAKAIEEHGIQALKSLIPEKFEEPPEMEKAKQEAETIKSILDVGNQTFVIRKDGSKVQVSGLVGRNILLYFSANGKPDRNFLPKLIEAYHKIKAKDNLFEVIFISSDNEKASFDEFFSRMPWLALPFGDMRNACLIRKLNVSGTPTPIVVAIGPTGHPVTTNAADLIRAHGADAYPFTNNCLKDSEEMVKRWPKQMKHMLHKEHQLFRTKPVNYVEYSVSMDSSSREEVPSPENVKIPAIAEQAEGGNIPTLRSAGDESEMNLGIESARQSGDEQELHQNPHDGSEVPSQTVNVEDHLRTPRTDTAEASVVNPRRKTTATRRFGLSSRARIEAAEKLKALTAKVHDVARASSVDFSQESEPTPRVGDTIVGSQDSDTHHTFGADDIVKWQSFSCSFRNTDMLSRVLQYHPQTFVNFDVSDSDFQCVFLDSLAGLLIELEGRKLAEIEGETAQKACRRIRDWKKNGLELSWLEERISDAIACSEVYHLEASRGRLSGKLEHAREEMERTRRHLTVWETHCSQLKLKLAKVLKDLEARRPNLRVNGSEVFFHNIL